MNSEYQKLEYQIIKNNRHFTGLLPDYLIRQHVGITPFAEHTSHVGDKKIISYGLSSYGYDIRLGYKFKIFTPALCTIVDPKNFDTSALVDVDISPNNHAFNIDLGTSRATCINCGKTWDRMPETGQPCPVRPLGSKNYITIPPNSYVLGESIETFDIPRDIMCIGIGKSTYARCGIVPAITPLEAGWRGVLTIEIANHTPLPARIWSGEGIAQLLFFRTLADCETSYADRKDGGKYQNQSGLTLPK